MRDEDEDRGTRPGNGERETLWPHPNSVTGMGNEDPHVWTWGGRVTLYLDGAFGPSYSPRVTDRSPTGNEVRGP